MTRKMILLNALVAALAKVQADGTGHMIGRTGTTYCRIISDRMETISDKYGWGA